MGLLDALFSLKQTPAGEAKFRFVLHGSTVPQGLASCVQRAAAKRTNLTFYLYFHILSYYIVTENSVPYGTRFQLRHRPLEQPVHAATRSGWYNAVPPHG